ncbi:hypothetical protein J1605_009359 [Eschrichtius robustus]|uniref:Uncharacterized protein n=1 Tax=Eschrichtius robustus TaxID=9764 RepID=A0AB34GWY7_ESCRO|nr:hypothetical protein J1605_009359 [Eschrichtius robustus]
MKLFPNATALMDLEATVPNPEDWVSLPAEAPADDTCLGTSRDAPKNAGSQVLPSSVGWGPPGVALALAPSAAPPTLSAPRVVYKMGPAAMLVMRMKLVQARGIQSRPTRPAVQRQGSTETRRARLRDQALHITLTTLRKTSPGLGAQQERSGTSLIRSVHWCLLSTYCVPDTPLRAGHRAANKPSDQGVIRGTRQNKVLLCPQQAPLDTVPDKDKVGPGPPHGHTGQGDHALSAVACP